MSKMTELVERAQRAVRELDDWTSENETAFTGWGEQIVPPEATFWRVKAGQALKALEEIIPYPNQVVNEEVKRLPGKMLDCIEIMMGHGLVDIGPITWGTRKGVLLAPRDYVIPPGEPGRLQDQTYWPVRGDVVIWIDKPGAGAGIVEELQKL